MGTLARMHNFTFNEVADVDDSYLETYGGYIVLSVSVNAPLNTSVPSYYWH